MATIDDRDLANADLRQRLEGLTNTLHGTRRELVPRFQGKSSGEHHRVRDHRLRRVCKAHTDQDFGGLNVRVSGFERNVTAV